MGSGANNTARYLGSALGLTIGTVIITHASAASGVAGLISGWNSAVLVSVAFSMLGARGVSRPRNFPRHRSCLGPARTALAASPATSASFPQGDPDGRSPVRRGHDLAVRARPQTSGARLPSAAASKVRRIGLLRHF